MPMQILVSQYQTAMICVCAHGLLMWLFASRNTGALVIYVNLFTHAHCLSRVLLLVPRKVLLSAFTSSPTPFLLSPLSSPSINLFVYTHFFYYAVSLPLLPHRHEASLVPANQLLPPLAHTLLACHHRHTTRRLNGADLLCMLWRAAMCQCHHCETRKALCV